MTSTTFTIVTAGKPSMHEEMLSDKFHVETAYFTSRPVQSRFSQTHAFGNTGINTNSVIPWICNFLIYFQHIMLVNVKLDVSRNIGLHFKVAGFLGLVNFKGWQFWHSVLWRVCEKPEWISMPVLDNMLKILTLIFPNDFMETMILESKQVINSKWRATLKHWLE